MARDIKLNNEQRKFITKLLKLKELGEFDSGFTLYLKGVIQTDYYNVSDRRVLNKVIVARYLNYINNNA